MREELREESKKIQRKIMQDITREQNKGLTSKEVMAKNIRIRQLRNLQRLAQI